MLQQGCLCAVVQSVSGTPVVLTLTRDGQLQSLLGAPAAVLRHCHHVCLLEAVVVAPAPCVWTAPFMWALDLCSICMQAAGLKFIDWGTAATHTAM